MLKHNHLDSGELWFNATPLHVIFNIIQLLYPRNRNQMATKKMALGRLLQFDVDLQRTLFKVINLQLREPSV